MSINPDQHKVDHGHAPWPTDETVVTPDPRHQDDFHEKFDTITTSDYDKKWYQKPAVRIGGTALALVAAGGAFVGLHGGDKNSAPRANAHTSAPANPSGNNETTPTQETDTATNDTLDYRLSADKYTQEPKQIIVDYFTIFNDWQNTGASKKAATAMERFKLADDVAYGRQLDQASNDAFEKDMLVANWQENPDLVKFVNISETVHAQNTALAIKTSDGSNREDLVPYQRFLDLDQSSIVVQSATSDKIVVSGLSHGRDNSDQNNADETSTGVNPNEEHGGDTLTFVKVGDQFRLADITPYNG